MSVPSGSGRRWTQSSRGHRNGNPFGGLLNKTGPLTRSMRSSPRLENFQSIEVPSPIRPPVIRLRCQRGDHFARLPEAELSSRDPSHLEEHNRSGFVSVRRRTPVPQCKPVFDRHAQSTALIDTIRPASSIERLNLGRQHVTHQRFTGELPPGARASASTRPIYRRVPDAPIRTGFQGWARTS